MRLASCEQVRLSLLLSPEFCVFYLLPCAELPFFPQSMRIEKVQNNVVNDQNLHGVLRKLCFQQILQNWKTGLETFESKKEKKDSSYTTSKVEIVCVCINACRWS